MNKKEREALETITNKAETSEKAIEAFLVRQMEEVGGIALKYASDVASGYPDRLCVLPAGRSFWVEVKSKGKRPRPLQIHRMLELKRLGQTVYVADSREKVREIISDEVQAAQLPGEGDRVD